MLRRMRRKATRGLNIEAHSELLLEPMRAVYFPLIISKGIRHSHRPFPENYYSIRSCYELIKFISILVGAILISIRPNGKEPPERLSNQGSPIKWQKEERVSERPNLLIYFINLHRTRFCNLFAVETLWIMIYWPINSTDRRQEAYNAKIWAMKGIMGTRRLGQR